MGESFEEAMQRLQTYAGHTYEQLQEISQGILDLAVWSDPRACRQWQRKERSRKRTRRQYRAAFRRRKRGLA